MKKIEDYLHLYIGCETNFGKLVAIDYYSNYAVCLIENRLEAGDLKECKPILRPLSDMTEEEAKKLLTIRYHHPGQEPIYQRHSSLCIDFKFYYSETKFSETQLDYDCLDAFSVHYLISIGIDLFGLIESGFAISIK